MVETVRGTSGEEAARALRAALRLPEAVPVDALCGDLLIEVPQVLAGALRVNGRPVTAGRRVLLDGDTVSYAGRRVLLELPGTRLSGGTRTLARSALAADFLCELPLGPRLVVLDGPGAGRRWPLAEGAHRLGRGLEAEVVIVDPTVSRLHALLEVEADGTFVRDLGSTHGTRLTRRGAGRRRVGRRRRRLRHGDEIGLGRTWLRYLDCPPPTPEASAPPREDGRLVAAAVLVSLAGGAAALAALLA